MCVISGVGWIMVWGFGPRVMMMMEKGLLRTEIVLIVVVDLRLG